MKTVLSVLFVWVISTTPLQNKLAYEEYIPASYRAKFAEKVIAISERLKIHPDWLMVSMAFETGRTFRPNIRNRYSGATGLIQFIPSTAANLGTSVNALGRMSAVDQLDYVETYFRPYAGKMHSVHDVYLVIFAPAFLGCPDNQIVYSSFARTELGRRRYQYNRGLDLNRNGRITIWEVKQNIAKHVPK